ncbi:unnamed protein product [Lactuca virosa]|uniref:Uncharacterized protein n=1 Tax=Lactuca virosa TaxID=75947 RepID=A0AAU9PAQ8_9ASTR|nr:unnamed protein product [Lactuca virosa]
MKSDPYITKTQNLNLIESRWLEGLLFVYTFDKRFQVHRNLKFGSLKVVKPLLQKRTRKKVTLREKDSTPSELITHNRAPSPLTTLLD